MVFLYFRIVFNKIRALVGGKVRLMASGGAPLSPETHDFIRTSLSVPVFQGYGLTESCACACVMDGKFQQKPHKMGQNCNISVKFTNNYLIYQHIISLKISLGSNPLSSLRTRKRILFLLVFVYKFFSSFDHPDRHNS